MHPQIQTLIERRDALVTKLVECVALNVNDD